MLEAVRTCETSVYSNETTRRYIPEGSHFHIRPHDNLKPHTDGFNILDFVYCIHTAFFFQRN
jgi:hypothetical protein